MEVSKLVFSGLIYKVYDNYFSIKINNKLEYFFVQKSLNKKFCKYLYPGIFVKFEVEEEQYIYKKINCNRVSYFIEILNRRFTTEINYYSIDKFRSGIKSVLDNLNNIVFIDLELNMHDYYPIKNFISEIIEIGYCVCDNKLNIIEEKNIFINPTVHKKITKRTIKFLNYKEDKHYNRKKYMYFYNDFVNLIKTYDPCFIVWGRSDIVNIRQSFVLNNVPPVKFKFIDLSVMHVNYYNLKNSPGLFKTAQSYNKVEIAKQNHNALEDAQMTRLVFSKFKESIK